MGHSWVCPGFSGAPQVTGDPTKDGVPVPRPAPTARSTALYGPLVVSTTWVRSSLASTPARPTHLPLGLAAHVLRVGPSDGHAGLVAAPQPVATLVSPGALCLPGAATRAGGSLSLAPVSPWAGAGLDPQIQGGAEPPALTGPQRRTSHSRGPVSCGSECSWRSLHTPAREAGTPGGTRAASMTPDTSQRGAPQTMMPGCTGSTPPFPTKPQEPQHRRKAEQGRLPAAQRLDSPGISWRRVPRSQGSLSYSTSPVPVASAPKRLWDLAHLSSQERPLSLTCPWGGPL